MSSRESGVVLLVALIMLLLVTIMGVVGANVVQTNLKVVQNIEARSVARNAALTAMEEAIATPGFLDGTKAFVVGCQSSSYTRCLDLTGDGREDDITVTLTVPICISVSPVKNAELDVLNDIDDASCYQPGIFSLCADALWAVTATAIDLTTGARAQIRQGIETRTTMALVETACS